MTTHPTQLQTGHCRQLGATPEHGGVNFAIWGRPAALMGCCCLPMRPMNIPKSCCWIRRSTDPATTGTSLFGLHVGQIYGWRVVSPLIALQGVVID